MESRNNGSVISANIRLIIPFFLDPFSQSRSRSVFILGNLVGEDVVFPAFDPLDMAVAEQDVSSRGPVIVIFVRVVVDSARASAIAINNEPNLCGTNAQTFEH